MLRRLLAAFALLLLVLPASLCAQDKTASSGPVIITGVVREQGVTYEPIGAVDYYGQMVSFVAWRQDDGPVETTLLWLAIKVDTLEAQQALQEPFRKGRQVRFVIDGPVSWREPPGSPPFAEARLAKLLGPDEDPALAAAAQQIFHPDPITDPALGVFKPHPRLLDQFEQEREWLGGTTMFGLVLEPMGPTARERALAMAKLAWTNRAAIDETIREAIADHIYAHRAEEAGLELVPVDGGEPITHDDLPPMSRADFKADHTLIRVTCSSQNYCVFSYNANRLDWSYSYEATIVRDGEGWRLDGWDFP